VTAAGVAKDAAAQERAARLEATRRAMDEDGLAALVLASPENIYYLTGLNHYGYFATTLLLVGREGPPRLVARTMELPTLRVQTPDCEHVTYGDDGDPAETAAAALRHLVTGGARVGYEQDSMNLPVRVWRGLAAALPGTEWADAGGLLAAQRAVKSPVEIAHVRAAAAISDRALQAGIAAVADGVTERKVAATIYRELIAAGSDAPAFPPFVRASEEIPQEHVTWSDRVLRRGDRVFFELGASVARYHAPMSRIVYLGRRPAGADAASEVVAAGLEAVRSSLRPGVRAGDVYAAWHAAVARGLGDDGYHRHHCGYLTGLGFPPSWVGGSAVVGLRRDSDLVVQEGMVFHVMSWLLGQSLPDYGVSDTAVVTAGGCELLTTTAREPHATGT
jgi:Xaa-Pro dipeptidase